MPMFFGRKSTPPPGPAEEYPSELFNRIISFYETYIDVNRFNEYFTGEDVSYTTAEERKKKYIERIQRLKRFLDPSGLDPQQKQNINEMYRHEGIINLINKTLAIKPVLEPRQLILNLSDMSDQLKQFETQQEGGYKKTAEKVQLGKLTRVVYKGPAGKKYVKLNGGLVHLTEAKRKHKER